MSISHYLRFYFQSKTKYQIHSPFVFDFVEQILEDNRRYYFFDTIENYRRDIYRDNNAVPTFSGKQLRIKSLASRIAVSREVGQLLFKMIHYYKPRTVIEVGTFPAIATLYQSSASLQLNLASIENNTALIPPLSTYFKRLGVSNVTILQGDIDQMFISAIQKGVHPDFLFIKKLPSIEAMKEALRHLPQDSILVLHQPYKNDQYLAFWDWIKEQNKTTLSIDLYQLGIIFFRKTRKEKEHFKLIKWRKKPWASFW